MMKKGKSKPDSVITKIFSENLKSLISTNKSLAVKIGVSEPTVAEYVNGVSIPRGDILLAISKELNKSVDWLLTGEEKKVAPEPPPQETSINLTLILKIIEEQNKRIEEQKDLISAQGERITDQGSVMPIKKFNPCVALTIIIGITLFLWTVCALAVFGAIQICRLAGWLG